MPSAFWKSYTPTQNYIHLDLPPNSTIIDLDEQGDEVHIIYHISNSNNPPSELSTFYLVRINEDLPPKNLPSQATYIGTHPLGWDLFKLQTTSF